MSFVLEALRKSERERTTGVVPDVAALVREIPSGEPPPGGIVIGTRPALALAVAGALILAAVVFRLSGAEDNAVAPVDHSPQPADIVTQATTPAREPPAPPVAASPPPAADPGGVRFLARVVGIRSGCLIEIDRGGRLWQVTLSGTICPDAGTKAGKLARRFTTRRVFTRDVFIDAWRSDGSGKRLSGDVLTEDGALLNRELVRSGLARTADIHFQQDEADARRMGLGLWAGGR